MALYISTLCVVGLLEGNFLVLFIFMVGCEVQGNAYLGAFGWLLVVNTCWLIRDGFFNSSELGGCSIYFNLISLTFIVCAGNSIIKNLQVVYGNGKPCLFEVRSMLKFKCTRVEEIGFRLEASQL
jgi:hypothetical protein